MPLAVRASALAVSLNRRAQAVFLFVRRARAVSAKKRATPALKLAGFT